MTKKERYTIVLGKYLPEEFVPYVIDLLVKYPVRFKISRPRKTKLGDFKHNPEGYPTITVNGDLNQYAFLVTTLHEFAHLIAFREYGFRIKPHGKEWQLSYSRLLKPVVESGHLPSELNKVLINSLINVKASSCSDKKLHKALMQFDKGHDEMILLEDLKKDSIFQLNGKLFTKGNLRRTRFVCMENTSQRMYLISALAQVKVLKNEE